MTELEQEVLDIIEQTTCCKYIGKLKVDIFNDNYEYGDTCKQLNDTIYQLKLYLDREFIPMIFTYEGNEEDFKDFLRCEFKRRKIEKTKFFKVVREPIVLDEELTERDDE